MYALLVNSVNLKFCHGFLKMKVLLKCYDSAMTPVLLNTYMVLFYIYVHIIYKIYITI